MTELALTALALGVAGLDPAGLALALSALAAGARDRTVVVFAAVVLVGTALLGTVLSLTAGQELQRLDWASFLPPDRVSAVVELVIAAGLLAWAAVRLRRPGARPPRPRDGGRSGRALVGAGVLFAATAPLDPTFLGLVVVAGRDQPAAAVASAHVIWIVVSQLPLMVLAGAVLAGRHVRVTTWMQDVLVRSRPVLARVATGALVLVGVVLALDAVWWFVGGRFLLPDPT